MREVKNVEQAENIVHHIRTQKAKSGNMILEIPNKEEVNNLADVLKHRLGKTVKIRHTYPSIPLIFIGIEDSVEPDELKSTLVWFNERLNDVTNFTIRESKTGVRIAMI